MLNFVLYGFCIWNFLNTDGLTNAVCIATAYGHSFILHYEHYNSCELRTEEARNARDAYNFVGAASAYEHYVHLQIRSLSTYIGYQE